MSNSWQNEVPKARINLRLDLHTSGATKKTELPLKLLVAGNYSNGAEQRPVSEREPVDINKKNLMTCYPNFLLPYPNLHAVPVHQGNLFAQFVPVQGGDHRSDPEFCGI